ncbi:methionine--tRNA ligase subunit beta, partial [Alicyclobacillus cellulosilyticus]|uniref:methionine--tRNA ligase subunit beta n=1 Tax=Alicyclobacillus cellulosilyticus TaxID=1003997 RepID=UPI00166B24A1
GGNGNGLGDAVAGAAGRRDTAVPPADSAAGSAAAGKPIIGIEQFDQVEMRVAQVVAAERIPGADKLLRLEVDLGGERRQIVSGIAQHYAPEALLGRKVVVVTNLKPAKLRGVMSYGMVLAASAGDRLQLVTVPDDMPNGAEVR